MKNLAHLTRVFYVCSILFRLGISFHMATYVIFLKHHGLSPLEWNLVNIFFHASIVLFEVPTGILADRAGRKRSFLVAAVLMGLGFLWYGSSSTFWHFVIAEVIIALGATFASGAFEAWFFDHYKALGGTEENKIFSKVSMYEQLAVVIGSVIGSSLADIWLPFPFVLGGVAYAAVVIYGAVTMKETAIHHSAHVPLAQYYRDIRQAAHSHLNDRSFLVPTLAGVALAFGSQSLNMFWQPFMEEKLPIAALGYVSMTMTLLMAAGSYWGKRYASHEGIWKTVVWTGIIMSLVLITSNWYFVAVLFLAHEFPRGIFKPILSVLTNKSITDSSKRATLLSVQSMVFKLASTTGLLASGILAEFLPIRIVWGLSGISMIILCVWWMRK